MYYHFLNLCLKQVHESDSGSQTPYFPIFTMVLSTPLVDQSPNSYFHFDKENLYLNTSSHS